MEKNQKKNTPENPRKNANPISVITFAWILKTFILGYQRDLEMSDLHTPLDEHSSSQLGERIVQIWEEEEKQCAAKKNGSHPSLLRVLMKQFGPKIMLYGVMEAVLELLIKIPQPLALGRLLHCFTQDRNTNGVENEAYIWAGVMATFGLLNCFVSHSSLQGIMHMGMKIRIACSTLAYRKILRLSKISLVETTVGQVVNLLSNDVNRLDYAVYFFHYIWLGPLQSLVITYFIYQEVGWSAVAGMCTLLIFVPLQGYLGKKTSELTLMCALRTDERLRLMNEIINGVQVIKMYTWEKPFSYLVAKARRKEVNAIQKNAIVQGTTLSFDMYVPRLGLFVTILIYILQGENITAEKVFMITAFYDVLRMSMTIAFPLSINQIAESLISIRRLEKFLLHKEVEKHVVTDYEYKPKQFLASPVAISLTNATAKWITDIKDDTLTNINLTAKPGQLIAIIGQVGAGKSSLLQVLLRELPLQSGTIETYGKIAYSSQEPWLFASSVRQNILFDRPMDKVRYDNVIDVCQLKRDLTLFPYGDKTIVSERGISLSGGQRARINLARAVYAEADIYLLDDPLSAVDAHVGKHIFEQCIDGYLKGKTRILVTHQFQYLKNVERIIIMNNGAIQADGSFDELQASGLDLTKYLECVEEVQDEVENTRRNSKQSLSLSIRSEEALQDDPVEVAESRTIGRITGTVYVSYFRAAGNTCLVLSMFVICILNQTIASGGDYFIAYWVNVEEAFVNHTNGTTKTEWQSFLSRDWCIYLYSGFTVATIILTFLRTFAFFGVCMRSSRKLHADMFYSIIRATMRFFNSNTSGRILNRFSKDMEAVDVRLPMGMIDVIQVSLLVIAVIIIVASVNPWLMIPTACAGLIYYLLAIFYISTSRSVKRLEGITRSPVFGHISATLQGLATIRSFDAENTLISEFDSHQDLHSSSWFISISGSRAFAFYLDIACLFYTTTITFSLVLLSSSIYVGNLGLVISQCIGLTGILQWGIRQVAVVENQMTSTERILEYCKLEQEPPLESTPDNKPNENWPTEGRVQFKNLYLTYIPEDPPVLRNLNFIIMPREKIGIVGRTGAGKSSLIAALFRLAPIEGDILIDNVSAKSLGLHDLRSKISIIPQEPVLFSGTVRRNLDPFDEYSDDLLWQALEEVELKEIVNELAAGLNTKLQEGGSNFSVGQRQLLCLARAIVRNNKILVLDEATANVDPRTDFLIQKTIRRKFENCTVLTIAHRLNTVMDSSKILVMDAGTMVEFDHPFTLLQNKHSLFYNMVQQVGHAVAETLTKIAEDSYHLRKCQ
ncbi:probable multidrug resistance-associated protein lethal(2)03659 [Cephus cinctus]|uniref:Probable multidrug resistance-associated protein lethal(2)03659 n=1 Tax=Cephus cinctus TaxID=211228 RepID=A0AAJ7FU72_CEPCN|nr:probable multidrug resistance-associated protein lethal(2)03659 [Cephus cinctus]XP_015608412.1 probable multidrug resistance-associated protein lethal(2)03659 [Cephus cinctus]XP_015608413.1 probable multidrug resistance-associated protein lethal(2)03659 [Cephus cinctus]XP_015608414.1 probable multidrug resistance-associated protein lethal(2)03659 [Cephus cinctus]XP_024947174.1 probable multidrug resistance-associated protein lethal(2)03659 [Cephus cinctus]